MYQNNNINWKPTISVIIPTYNSRNEIGQCLESLINQTYPRELVEIIVVDCGSDDTAKIAEKFASKILKSESRLTIGKARNKGISIATGEILAFIDSDCIAPRNWLEASIEDFEEFPEIGGILFGVSGGKTTFTKALNYEFAKNEKFLSHNGLGVEFGIVFKRIVFDLGCRFGEAPQKEGFILSNCIKKNGIPLLKDRTVRIIHATRASVIRWIKRAFTLGAIQRSYINQIGEKRITNSFFAVLALFSILSFFLYMFFPFNLMLPFITLLILAYYTVKNNILPNEYAPISAKLNFFFLGIILKWVYWIGYATKLITGYPKPKHYN